MVCPAPIPRSSGGRSAVSAISGSRRLVGLADRRVEVGGRGAGGAEDRHRRAGRLGGAEREEGGGALVDDHGHLDLRAGARAPRASGVEREPGERTAWRSPQRASSSTKAEASAVLALVESIVAAPLSPMRRESRRTRLEPVGLERRLVDLDPEAGARGRVEHAASQLALDRGDGRGEEPLGGEAVGEAGRRHLAQRLRDLRGRGDPDRAVEGAGDDRTGRTSAISIAASGPPTLESLMPASRAGADPGGALGVGAALDALVGRRSGSRSSRASSRQPPRSSPPAARRARRRAAPAPPASASRSPRPRRRWRRRGSARPARAPRARRAPGRRRRPAPSFSLKVEKPSSAQRSASATTAAGSPATSVALQRTGSGSAARGPRRSSGRRPPAAQVEQRGQRRAAGRRREARRVAEPRLVQRVAARSSALQLGDDLRQRRAAAQAERHRFAEPDQALLVAQSQQHHLAPLEPSRARSRRARGRAARRGLPRPRRFASRQPCTLAQLASSRPAETSRLKAASRAPVAARAAFSAGPSVRLVIARIGPIASGSESRPISGSALASPATRAIGRTTKAPSTSSGRARPRCGAPSAPPGSSCPPGGRSRCRARC